MSNKLKLIAAFLLMLMTACPALADQGSTGTTLSIVQAMSDWVTQLTTPQAPPQSEQADNTADSGDDADDPDDGADDDSQTADDINTAEDAISDAMDAYNKNDNPTAVQYLKKAAYQCHDPAAQNDLAQFYEKGIGVNRNYYKAFRLFHRAAAHGTGNIKAFAENSVGTMYARGWGVPQDQRRAFHWLNKSALHGNPEARANLAMLQRSGASFASNAAKIRPSATSIKGEK